MTDYEVDKLLSTTVPGGSQARDWFLPHDTEQGLKNVRDVVRLMFVAKNQDCEPDAWMDADGDLYATEPDKNWCQPHTPLYAAPPKRELLSKLFAEAIVWGMVYGPEIHPAQWDSIRDEQARAFADRSEVIGGQS